jgi:asparagine synthase (glutamine-hydrolysing)
LFDRPKWGFGAPLDKWLKKDLRYLIEEFLSEEKIKQAGLVEYDVVLELKNKYLNHPQFSHYYHRIWALIQLHNWYYNR